MKCETCIYFNKVNDFISKLMPFLADAVRYRAKFHSKWSDFGKKQKDLRVQQFEFDFEFQYKVKKWKYHITHYMTKSSVWSSKKRSPEIAPQIMQYYEIFQYVKSQIKETTHWQCKEWENPRLAIENLGTQNWPSVKCWWETYGW